MILLIVFVVVILAVGAFALFGPANRVFSPPTTPSPPSGRAPTGFPARSEPELRIPRLRDLSPGCLVGLMLGALVWFALWTVVLVLALRFLQTPYSGG